MLKHFVAWDNVHYRLAKTFVLDIPFTHLFIEFVFILLVRGPAHVEDVWCVFSLDNCFHEVFAAVEGMPTREFIFSAGPNLNFQAVH